MLFLLVSSLICLIVALNLFFLGWSFGVRRGYETALRDVRDTLNSDTFDRVLPLNTKDDINRALYYDGAWRKP